jgi:uncharacterized protein (DUF1778 family)
MDQSQITYMNDQASDRLKLTLSSSAKAAAKMKADTINLTRTNFMVSVSGQ